MPMYRRVYEWRYCTEDNKADIEQWAGVSNALLGHYYNAAGMFLNEDEFNERYREETNG